MVSIGSFRAFAGNKAVVRSATTVLFVMVAAVGLVQIPATAPKLEFDVASVRLDKSDGPPNANIPLGPGDSYVPNGGNFNATGWPVSVYIMFAYKLGAGQAQAIKQLPEWVSTEKYDIVAKTENHNATKDEMRLMMQSLLAERFKLVVHRETRQVPVYALVLAKPGVLGPKLVAHSASVPCDNPPPRQAGVGKTPPVMTIAGGFPTRCGGIVGLPPSAPGLVAMGGRNISIGLIAEVLTGMGNPGRPLLDQTGLAGKYDFLLEFAPERMPRLSDGASGAAPPDTTGPGLELALRQQLGLKLESTKGPLDVWVADHVEHPTAN